MADPDWTDPCDVLAWLRPQFYKVQSGLAVVSVSHGEASTTFRQANARELANLMRTLESECRAAQGGKRRRAFTAG
jgi:hypothetical protein